MHVSKPRRPNPDGFQASLGPTTMAAKTLPHDFQVLQPPEMKTSPPSDSTPTSTTNQDPSSPPAALTVVLSVACGAVATCILLTVRTPRPKKSDKRKRKKGPSRLRHLLWETLNHTLPDHPSAPAPSLLQTGFPPRPTCLLQGDNSSSSRRQSSYIHRWRNARRFFFGWHRRPHSQHARRCRGVPSHLAQQLSLY